MGWHKIPRDLRVIGAVQTSTTITVDTGGLVLTSGDVTVSAGAITQTAGNITVTAGGVDTAVVASTATATLTNYGTSIIGSSASTAAVTFTLTAPTVGIGKVVQFDSGSSDAAYILRASSAGAVTFDGTNFIATITTAGAGFQALSLMGVTTARWAIMGSYGTLTYSTS